MFDHVSIGVADIARSKTFYDAAFKPLEGDDKEVARSLARQNRRNPARDVPAGDEQHDGCAGNDHAHTDRHCLIPFRSAGRFWADSWDLAAWREPSALTSNTRI